MSTKDGTKEFTDFDIDKKVEELQILGIDLKNSILKLQYSVIKDYLLSEVSKIIELKSANAFYYLRGKISRMTNVVIRFELDKEMLRILEEMSEGIKTIMKHIDVKE